MHGAMQSDPKSFTRSSPLSPSLLFRVREAFRQGLALCPTAPAPQRTPPWSRELEESATLGPEQLVLVKHCNFHLSKARDFAVQGDDLASVRFFAIARTYRDNCGMGEEARQLCNSSLEAAEAYLDYVSGDLDAARRRILAAMMADQVLEESYGYAHLHVHRIHLANNLVKLEACAGRLHAALALAAELLRYIAGQLDSIHAPTCWGAAWTSALSEPARRYLAIQTTREIGCATAGHCDARTLSCWQQSVTPLMRAPAHSLSGGRLLEWYELKQSYLACFSQGGTENYLQNAATYLGKGPGDNSLCWQLAALDVMFACSACEGMEALELREEIAKILSQARSLPRHIAVLVQRARPAMAARQPGSYERHTHGSRKTGSDGE